MANSSLVLSSLDFDTLKQNFKNYLQSQSVLKDYDFEGSNINVLLDVMSYNSYLNSFYLNMISSEMFMDSAQKLDDVVSHAKELNYVRQSNKSSEAFLNFNIECTGISGSFVIPKGTSFYGINSNGTFFFTTSETVTLLSPNSSFSVANLAVYDGSYFKDTYITDYSVDNQKFVLSNPDIDTSSLTVTVTENGVNTKFTKAETLYNLGPHSNVYFLEASQNNLYEIVFGDTLLGRKPDNGSKVVAEYRIASGPAADGIKNFSVLPDLGAINGGIATIGTITTTGSALGSLAEDIESIRFRAPRYFATQQRAVATDDFSSLIYAKFGSQIEDIIVYGGQEMEPKLYGRVVVCIKPTGSTICPNYLKNEIIDYLKKYIVLPNRVVVTDPDYFYINISSTIQYDKTSTEKFPSDIKTSISASMIDFAKTNIQKFGKDFRYSKFIANIDNTETSITSNDTSVKIIKRISPLYNYATSFVINFNNIPEREGYYNGQVYVDERVITSSKFTYVFNGRSYPSSYLEDDGAGNIAVYGYVGNVLNIINPTAGKIDYTTGKLILNDFITSYYDNYISIYLTPQNKDIITSKNMILMIDPNDININVIQTIY